MELIVLFLLTFILFMTFMYLKTKKSEANYKRRAKFYKKQYLDLSSSLFKSKD